MLFGCSYFCHVIYDRAGLMSNMLNPNLIEDQPELNTNSTKNPQVGRLQFPVGLRTSANLNLNFFLAGWAYTFKPGQPVEFAPLTMIETTNFPIMAHLYVAQVLIWITRYSQQWQQIAKSPTLEHIFCCLHNDTNFNIHLTMMKATKFSIMVYSCVAFTMTHIKTFLKMTPRYYNNGRK